MKKMSNENGFTLIELLAVIVILSVLVLISVPATTSYLNSTRASATAINAKEAIDAVRQDVILNGFNAGAGGTKEYNLTEINKLLQKQLVSSPYGGSFSDSSVKVRVTQNSNMVYTYEMCMIDSLGNGFSTYTLENDITASTVKSPASVTDMSDCRY